MKRLIATSVVLAVVLFIVPLHVVSGTPAKESMVQAARLVRLDLRDGSSKVVRLDGVGCDVSICSRVAVNSRTVGNVVVNRTRFDTIAAIREISDDSAVFVSKDGSTRRVSVIPDNRVLYVIASDGHTQKIGLRQVKSIQFNPMDSQ
jgi:hypothetical protein